MRALTTASTEPGGASRLPSASARIELLEAERVARRRPRRCGARSSSVTSSPSTSRTSFSLGLRRELREAQLDDPALRPRAREEVVHLGPRRARGPSAATSRRLRSSASTTFTRRQVAPVQVLEHEHHRARGRTRRAASPRTRGASGRRAARGPAGRRAAAGSPPPGTARRRARRGTRVTRARRPRATRLATRARSFCRRAASGSPSAIPAAPVHRLRDHREGRAGAHRVAAADEHLHIRRAPAHRAGGTRGAARVLPMPGRHR